MYVIMELIPNSIELFQYIMDRDGELSEDLSKDIFRQIVQATSYLHDKKVVSQPNLCH